MSWWVTKLEAGPDGKTPVRVYHENGGGDPSRVTKTWTHPIEDRPDCEVCSK